MDVTRTIRGADENGAAATVVVTTTEPDQRASPSAATSRAETSRAATPQKMAIGATVKDEDFGQLSPDGPTGPLRGARFCRTFSAPGQGVLPWSAANRKVPYPVAEHHSFKDWPDDKTAAASINFLLDNLPARLRADAPLLPELHPYTPPWQDAARHDGFSFLLTYCHEGENNDLTPREWRRRHRIAYDVVRSHKYGDRVGYMAIQTDTWTKMASRPDEHKGDGDVLEFWAGVGDFAATDTYVMSVTNKPAAPALYPSPAPFFELAVRLAYASGRPLFIPEIGVIRQGSPADAGNLRAAWLQAVIVYLRSVGCAGVAWWAALGTGGRDFRLDPATLKVYQSAIAGVI